MIAIPTHMGELLGPLAASDGDAIGRLIVIAVVMIGSAVSALLKKKHEEAEARKTPPAPPAPPTQPTRWPPMGTTTGTTVPGQTRTGPLPPIARPAPPVARPAPAGPGPQTDDTADRRRRELEGVERDRQERSEGIEREVLDQAERLHRETQARAQEARAKAEAGRRVREAAQRVRKAAEQASAARAAAPMAPEAEIRRMVADESSGRRREMSPSLKALLAEPSMRKGIILAEILSPPVALRDPEHPAGTTPSSLST